MPLSSVPLQTLVANGDTRTLSFGHIHTNETLTVTFKRAGRYDPESLKQLNWFMRDWRTDEATRMDPHLFDLLWEIHREVNAREPVTIVSAYRSPKTNEMLRSRGRGVARNSQHTTGKAIDFFIPGSNLAEMRAIGLRLQRGGVGFYPRSGSPFMHVDTGGVRHWPRMTRDQLARVFPDGKTVHIPSDGKPMQGYALAKAEIEARRSQPAPVAVAAIDTNNTASDRIGSHPPPAPSARPDRTPIPTATVLTNPSPDVTRPPTQEAARTHVASLAPPLPLRRPSNLAPTVTASLPEPAARAAAEPQGQTLGQPRGQALGYAPQPERVLPNFGPMPATHTQLSQAEPARPPMVEPAIDYGEADAAQAPPTLLTATALAQFPELHHPELKMLRGLIAPARAAVQVRFAGDSVMAPATARFSGPAVVALRTLAFDRGAGIVTGSIPSSSRTN